MDEVRKEDGWSGWAVMVVVRVQGKQVWLIIPAPYHASWTLQCGALPLKQQQRQRQRRRSGQGGSAPTSAGRSCLFLAVASSCSAQRSASGRTAGGKKGGRLTIQHGEVGSKGSWGSKARLTAGETKLLKALRGRT